MSEPDEDIRNLFKKIGQAVSYQEIRHHSQTEEARERWPLLHSLQQKADFPEAPPPAPEFKPLFPGASAPVPGLLKSAQARGAAVHAADARGKGRAAERAEAPAANRGVAERAGTAGQMKGLFGKLGQAPAEAPADGLFGKTKPATEAKGLFGKLGRAPEAVAPSGGLFGKSKPAEAPKAVAGKKAAKTAAEPSPGPLSGLFGRAAPAQQPVSNLFGKLANEPQQPGLNQFLRPSASRSTMSEVESLFRKLAKS